MKNIEYEGYCPHCHNFWIFCDCIESYGSIGEDLARDEGAEEPDDDEVEVDDALDSPPDIDGIIVDPLVATPGGPATPGNQGSPLVPTNLFPTNPDDPVSPDLVTSWGAKNPSNKLSKPSYTPWSDVINNNIINDKDSINNMLRDPDFFTVPDGKKPKYDDVKPMDDDKLDGYRLPPDPNFQIPVAPDDDDDILFSPPGDFDLDLDGILNSNASNTPKQRSIPDLHKGYTAGGVPEYMRPGHRGDVLRDAGMPIFTGPVYSFPSIRPANATPMEKDSTDNLSKEYIDFLENELNPWLNSQPPEIKDWWGVGCKTTNPEDHVPKGTTQLTDKVISYKGRIRDQPNEYILNLDDGSTIIIRTDMDVAVDFFDKVTKPQLDSLLTGPNQDGVHEFKVEWNNGSPSIQTRTLVTKNARIVKFVSGVRRVVYPPIVGRVIVHYDEGGYENNNDYPKVVPYIPPVRPPPVYYYRKNTVLNTRRLNGTGALDNIFVANYENYNAATFMTLTHGKETFEDANACRTTRDNFGDPGFQTQLVYNSGTNITGLTSPSQIYKYVFEMVNESNDPAYKQSTYALFRVQLTTLINSNASYNIWIDKADGSRVYPRVMNGINSNANNNIILRSEGDPSNVIFSSSFAVTNISALIECPANDNYLNSQYTPNQYCCVNIQFYTRTVAQGVFANITQLSQLVKTNTLNQTFQPKPPVETIAPDEQAGVGKIIPTSFISDTGVEMAAVNYKNIWTKSLIWRRTSNVGNIVKYLVNTANVQTQIFSTYEVSTTPANRSYYMFAIYINDNGREDYTNSDFCVFNDTSIYPITSLSNAILHRLTMTLSFSNFIF